MTRHLSQEQVLRHLDGELSKLATWKTERHLCACWSCQVEFGRLKEQIAAILDADTAVFGPSLPPPPKPWSRLEPRLEQKMRENRVPFWKKVPLAGRALRTQLVYGGAALVLTLAAFSVWVSVKPASAKEVLQRAIAADEGRLAITEQQMVRQRVRVKKTKHLAPYEHATRLESWKSNESTYWKSGDDPVNAELLELYKANGLASALPLSPAVVETWAKIAGGEPSASHNRESFEVQIVSNPQAAARGLEEVSLHVQRQNWHLDEMTLFFIDATYQITEEESSIVARNDVPSDVMTFLAPPEPNPIQPAQGVTRTVAPTVNLDDLEMAVRCDLHSIGADLGEGIEISARTPGQVLVDVWQASPHTKERVLRLLANRPGVELEFRAPDADRLSGQGAAKTIPQTAAPPVPPDQRLIAFFRSAEAEENFTRSVLEACNNVLDHLHALGNLAGRWPSPQESRISSDSKIHLESMVRDHAREILRATLDIEKQLDPLIKNFGAPVRENVPAPAGSSWQDASASGLDAARRLDRILRSLLSTSDAPLSPEDALPGLQRGLRDLKLAARQLPTVAE